MTKEKLRSEAAQKRETIPLEERLRLSKIIAEKLASQPEFYTEDTVAFYVSKETEVYTHAMIREWLRKKRIVVPKVEGEVLVFYEINDIDEDLKPGSFGVLEPATSRKVSYDEIGLVIVPGVAFDEQGYRIGSGKGYYDKMLDGYKGKKIGLAFKMQMVPEVPKEGHDVPVDKVVTEERVIDCQ